MDDRPEQMYLDLLKKTLRFCLWPEPPVPIAPFLHQKGPVVRMAAKVFLKIFSLAKCAIVLNRDLTETERREGRNWPSYAHTMIGQKRLDNIQFAIERILEEGIEGDLIECGVWRGGACIFMRGVLAAYGVKDRRVFAADSFEGLPEPDPVRYSSDKGDELYKQSFLAVSQEEVAANFEKYGLLDEQVVFLKGWFKDTLPAAPVNKLALMRLDGDMYGSTMDILTHLYPKLSVGGFCVIDDFGLEACKQAINDYRAQRGITDEIMEIDWTGRYWRKSA